MTSREGMDADERDSRRLSRVLRHRRDVPHDDSGWFLMEDAARASGLTVERVREVAEGNHRYALSEDGTMVRAFHGHSNGVVYRDVVDPPETLYHGTSERGYAGILESGAILPMGRDAVHLSTTSEYAREVGRRRGTPVVLRIEAGRMGADGFVFHLSGDGVYLVDRVPVEYIALIGSETGDHERTVGSETVHD